jgi:adenine-specific DNA-methyltransferase
MTKLRCLTCRDQPLVSDIDGSVVLIHAMGGHELQEELAINTIIDNDRQRRDYGDMEGLVNSIKEYGIIQPILLARGNGTRVLVAGGRRLEALRRLHIENLIHAKHFVWTSEVNDNDNGRLRLQAMELEENLRRKDLHWSEAILAKAKLFELMQQLHKGVSVAPGGERLTRGFSLRKLAAMLGENPSVTSRDLDLAGYVAKHPTLAQMPTKADAMRKLGVAVTVAAMQSLAKTSTVVGAAASIGSATPQSTTVVGAETVPHDGSTPASAPLPRPQQDERWTLYEGRFQDNINSVSSDSVDLVATDLPYNIGLGTSSASHSAGLGSFDDSELDIVGLCADTAVAAYRVLRQDRFAVFFYGMNYHQVLYDSLTTAGFTVDPYSFIWLRDRSAPPDGFARYSKTYDPAFIASKGVPRFVRPNLPNSLAIPSVRGAARLHAAQKPVEVMQKFIEDMTTPNCVVLDMFAGAGTTGVAALKTKRKAILFELEPANCVLIRSQLGVL